MCGHKTDVLETVHPEMCFTLTSIDLTVYLVQSQSKLVQVDLMFNRHAGLS